MARTKSTKKTDPGKARSGANAKLAEVSTLGKKS